MRLRYFAWVRERIGFAEEDVDLPSGVKRVDDLIALLATRDAGYATAFAVPGAIRAALDRNHVPRDASLAGADEVAFFPPMTGG